jgi:hypothetical protein
MKIKTLVLTAILGIAAITRVYSFGVGIQGNFSAGGIFAPGAALVISPSDSTHLAVNWYFDFKNKNIIGLTLDAIPLVLPISKFKAGSFNFTFGGGLFANLDFNDPGLNAGLRLPLGVNLMLGKDTFELYTHVAPSFGLHLLPKIELSKPFFPVALGLRLWFH